jgi:hypothetical protein
MTPKVPDVLAQPPAVSGQAAESAPAPAPDDERRRRAALGEQAWAAFQRDWPQLAQAHYGRWVAYQGEQQLGIASTQTELYQECFRRGLQRGEFHVFGIEHPLPDDLYVDWPNVDR